MSSPIFDNLKATVDEISDSAYKRGHLQAQIEMLNILKSMNTDMMNGQQVLLQLVEKFSQIKTPAKAPKPRSKKVSA